MKAYLYLACLSLLLSGCSKLRDDPKPQLPPETQTGANTFGCRVNGEIWTYKDNASVNGLDADYNGSAMWVLARGQGATIKIDFSWGGIAHLGDYTLYSDSSSVYYREGATTYRTDSLTNGTLTMTRLDNQNAIVSGRFHFNAVNLQGDTVRITDGRFDVKYRY